MTERWSCQLCLCGMLLTAAGCSGESVKQAATQAASQAEAAAEQAGAAVEQAEAAATELSEKAGDAMSALGEGFSEAASKATAALEGVEGGSALLKQVTDWFTAAQQALGEVKDEASADGVLSKLGDLSGQADVIQGLVDKLPDQAKAAVMELISKGLPQLKALVDKALAIPGVEAVLKPKLDEILSKITGLAGPSN